MPLTKQKKELIWKYALQNAVLYGGKADPKAVLGKILGEVTDLRSQVAELRPEIENAVKTVNLLPPTDQKRELERIAPELLKREEKKEEGLPELEGAVMGKVVTRFAPATTGPLNIAHVLRALGLSYLYAKKYKGTFMLRHEDTDPKNVGPEFYDMIEEDVYKLGTKPDDVVYESDLMEGFYQHAEKLLREGKAYVCVCPAEMFKEAKLRKEACTCRDIDFKENLDKWRKMLAGSYDEGGAVVRLKTNMADPNPAARDPAILRIVKHPHPRHKRKYVAWPLYNFANVISDHKAGITHVFRAKEHEHNTSIQKRIYAALDWHMPYVVNFGMIYLPGMKLHTRDIREGIAQGLYNGWDDPRLHTVRALLRRGFQPEAFLRLSEKTGLTKTDITLGWENLEGINGKILDPKANRFMAVKEPIKIVVEGLRTKQVELDRHPDFPERGKRRVDVDPKAIYIEKDDQALLSGKELRLIGLCNLELDGLNGGFTGERPVKNLQKIQWVSVPYARVFLVTPERRYEGIGEKEMENLSVGDIIQMERIGFGRVDSKEDSTLTIYYGHR